MLYLAVICLLVIAWIERDNNQFWLFAALSAIAFCGGVYVGS
ncbi:hypothetical protein [Vibrio phage LP.1]|nr:hypothetical protein [Vibrio phage LP.1]